MNTLTLKEKTVVSIFMLVAFITLIMGCYQYYQQSLLFNELINIFAFFLIFIGLGLAPSMFFTPLKQLFSASFKPKTLIDHRIHQCIVCCGVLLALINLVL